VDGSPKKEKIDNSEKRRQDAAGNAGDSMGTTETASTTGAVASSLGQSNLDNEDEYESSEPKTVVDIGHRRISQIEFKPLKEGEDVPVISNTDPPESIEGEESEVKPLIQRKKSSKKDITKAAAADDNVSSSVSGNHLYNIHSSPLPEFNLTYTPPVFPKSDADAEFISLALQRNFVFANALTSDDDAARKQELKRIVDAFEFHTVKESGVTILNAASVGDYFYILKAGCVDYVTNGEKIGMAYRPGQSFGELCLLYDCPPPADCVSGYYCDAKEPCEDGSACELWRIDKMSFRKILALRTMRRDERMRDAIKKIKYLKELDDEFINRIADALEVKGVKKGEVLYKVGDPADKFYVLGGEGRVMLTSATTGMKNEICGPGDTFGEKAIVSDEPRIDTATVVESTTLLFMTRENFDRVVGSLKDAILVSQDRRLLRSIPLFKDSDFEDFEYELLAALIETVHFKGGKEICLEFERVEDPALYIIREGILDVLSDEYPEREKVLRNGDIFGEYTLLPDKNMKFGGAKGGNVYFEESVEVVSDTAVCGKLTLSNIDSVILDLHRLGCKRRGRMQSRQKSAANLQRLEDLDFHRLFGAGTFGRVWIVSSKGGNTPYALKIQSKRELLDQRQSSGALRERTVMAKLDHPFVCKLISTFQDDDCIYMLLTFIQGGELLNLIQGGEMYGGLPESAAKFYAATIVEGLTYMHRRHILYRDLKPENVLLDKDGYAVIVDFGFSKIVTDKTYTFCGTPLYLAPEIILARGHDRGVDYWSLGCVIYEMLFATTPFYIKGIDQKGLFKRIVRGKWNIPEGATISKPGLDLIFGMLQKRSTERLGCLAGGYRDIKNHQWFREVNFVKLVKKQIKAPWVPRVENPLDTSCFDFNEDTNERDFAKGRKKLTEDEQLVFADF